jgi:hypothetical protein
MARSQSARAAARAHSRRRHPNLGSHNRAHKGQGVEKPNAEARKAERVRDKKNRRDSLNVVVFLRAETRLQVPTCLSRAAIPPTAVDGENPAGEGSAAATARVA